MPINWCPSCKIGLANEEVVEGKCERCGTPVVRKEREQWMLKITKYAERLLQDLDKVDYPEKVKTLERDWIGKSEGVEIKFSIFSRILRDSINVFTTRIDTIFGATYLVLAPEHPVIENLKSQISNLKRVKEYIEKAKGKLERERISETREKTGMKLEGVMAINPATGKEIPVFVADYVLMHYGTGAIMGVPCHDERDFEFARQYNLPMIEVIEPEKKEKEPTFALSNGRYQHPYTGEGILVNSGRFDGMRSEVARERIFQWLERKGLVKKAVHYKLRDWVFSRQRYWGEPIPIIYCRKCWETRNPKPETRNLRLGYDYTIIDGEKYAIIPVPEKDLPVKLPNIKDFKPTETGESPLAKAEKWINTECPKCGGPARRETDVMPNWAGSNWYYLRYCDPHNDKKLADPKKLLYWMAPARRSSENVGGVDWYNGGMEHTTLHLLYSRFIYKFLWDIGAVPKSLGPEPYKKRTSHGIILAEGGVKMSKSKGNVINPDEVVKQYGADTLRCYEMFMGPFEQAIAWDTKGVKGVRRFLQKVWELFETQNSKLKTQKYKAKIKNNKELKKLLHKTIKKVSEDIENMKFNTAISAMMEFCNAWQENPSALKKRDLKDFLKILSPFAPHLTEELYQKLKNLPRSETKFLLRGQNSKLKSTTQSSKVPKFKSIFQEKWPKYDPKLIEEEKITLVIQINGKVRDKIEVEKGISENKAKKLALSQSKIQKWLQNKKIKKAIFIKDKLINFVV